MAALTWILERGIPTPAVIASLAVAGTASGLLFWITHRSIRQLDTKMCRIQRRTANLAGEVSALRSEHEDR